jgi:DNA replication and repair protein RecF
MRERRLWLDRSASALDATYRRLCQVYEQTLRQRNAALERRSSDLPAWDEAFAESGASLRVARAAYADKLNAALLASTYRPTSEHYSVLTRAESRDPDTVRQKLHLELGRLRTAELAAGRSLAGPHRDPIDLTIDGEDAARFASSGQSRSLLLALTLAALSIHEAETGETAIALLDDLDSELDETRAARICEVVAARGQALLTTAHSEWARSICGQGTLFHVDAGEVKAA